MWIDENVGLGLFILSIVIGYAFGALWGWGLFGLGLLILGILRTMSVNISGECPKCKCNHNTKENENESGTLQ